MRLIHWVRQSEDIEEDEDRFAKNIASILPLLRRANIHIIPIESVGVDFLNIWPCMFIDTPVPPIYVWVSLTGVQTRTRTEKTQWKTQAYAKHEGRWGRKETWKADRWPARSAAKNTRRNKLKGDVHYIDTTYLAVLSYTFILLLSSCRLKKTFFCVTVPELLWNFQPPWQFAGHFSRQRNRLDFGIVFNLISIFQPQFFSKLYCNLPYLRKIL